MIHFVLLHLGENRLDAVVTDPGGSRRKIALRWQTRVGTNVPPANWHKQVLAETRWAYDEAVETAAGRRVPR